MAKSNCARDGYKIVTTLCWDCANALGGCEWSVSFKPVPGWKAKKTWPVSAESKKKEYDSYRVLDCPKFVRDSYVDKRGRPVRLKEVIQSVE